MLERIKSWFATWKQQREYKKEVARLKKLAKKKYGDEYNWYYQRASRVRGDTREIDNMDILTYMLLVDMLDVNSVGNSTSGYSNSSRYDDSDSYSSSSSYSSSYDSGSSSSSSSWD